MKHLFIIFLLSLAIHIPGFTQTDKPLRVEIEAAPDNPLLEVIPAGPKGVIVFNNSARKVDKTRIVYQATLYNQNLQKIWVKDMSIVSDAEYISNWVTDSCIALLFINSGSKSDPVLYTIAEVNLRNGEQKTYSGKLPEKSAFSGFVYLNGRYYLALNGTKEQGSVYEINTITGITKEFEFRKNEGGPIYCLKEDIKNNRILIIKGDNSGKKEIFTLLAFSANGSKLFSAEIIPSEDNSDFTQMLILPLDSHRIIIAGTYVHHNEKSSSSKPEELVNTGFFTSLFTDSIMKSIHYYNFIEYKNFHNYISQENLIKIRKKAERKGIKESDFSLNYKLLLHDLTRINKNYMLTAEVFTPEYRTVTRTTVDFYGRPMPETYTVFDGYRLLNVLLFAFDDSCHYAWDNNFEVFDVLDLDLYKRISLMQDSSNIILAYNTEGKLVYKVVNGSKTIEGPEHIKVDTGHNSDKVSEEKRSHIIYWYGNYMLTYGYQQINNHILPGRNTRSVFYLNKIGYR